MNNKACDGVINVIFLALFLSLCFAFSLPSLFLSLQTPLTSLLFFFFFSSLSLTLSTLFLSRLTVKLLSSQDRLWVGGLQVGVGGFRSAWVAPDRSGWLQIGVGGFRPAWGHWWPWGRG